MFLSVTMHLLSLSLSSLSLFPSALNFYRLTHFYINLHVISWSSFINVQYRYIYKSLADIIQYNVISITITIDQTDNVFYIVSLHFYYHHIVAVVIQNKSFPLIPDITVVVVILGGVNIFYWRKIARKMSLNTG